MGAPKLMQYLNENNIQFETLEHPTAYTAQEIAQKSHIKGKDIAKTVMVKIDGEIAMAVLPSNDMLDIDLLQKACGGGKVDLIKENEFKDNFSDCELGAMPPFGNLYHMKVWVDVDLAKDEKIAFNAGNHHELCLISYSDFEKLVSPIRADIHKH
ncbi:MAG: deacylase [Epsilonproteobacteria bacterium]|nr:MAG: deacylase [Campylobacterota bacterium]RLA66207.1 MAG: deacylase [Campylobacterota bacterium]